MSTSTLRRDRVLALVVHYGIALGAVGAFAMATWCQVRVNAAPAPVDSAAVSQADVVQLVVAGATLLAVAVAFAALRTQQSDGEQRSREVAEQLGVARDAASAAAASASAAMTYAREHEKLVEAARRSADCAAEAARAARGAAERERRAALAGVCGLCRTVAANVSAVLRALGTQAAGGGSPSPDVAAVVGFELAQSIPLLESAFKAAAHLGPEAARAVGDARVAVANAAHAVQFGKWSVVTGQARIAAERATRVAQAAADELGPERTANPIEPTISERADGATRPQ